MSNQPEYISAQSDQDVLILTIAQKKVDNYELAEAIGKELSDAAGRASAKMR